ncbi:Bud site selection protein 3 [Spathaspora sp. JA1]|nr:Bud site selection protein 3 [Spathaspora sp. JA1]
MSLYTRYVSREHDKDFFNQQKQQQEQVSSQENHPKQTSSLIIPQLNASFDNSKQQAGALTVAQWVELFPKLSFYTAYDEILFQQVLILVQIKSNQYTTFSWSKFGWTKYSNLILDSTSRFFTSVENLIPKYQANPSRRALAITNLKNCNRLINHGGNLPGLPVWDGINAGQLTNSMVELTKKSEIGNRLVELGMIQSHCINSFTVDVIYDNTTNQTLVEENNQLVNLLGIQSQYLFDPLLEYSPESINITYNPPHTETDKDPKHISAILDELISIQENYTLGLVELLQNFLIPLRITVLNSNNPTTTITKLNSIFPPTIDEITRINCILHAALSKARKFNHMEVIKALAMFMPFFYKALIRHEANINGFSKKLQTFNQKNKRNIFDNLNINKSAYSIREIDSIIIGVLMELPKIKLILKRLQRELPQFPTETQQHYDSIIKVIDAFGTCDDIKIDTTTKRIFTPTGKILTELASNWPKELQYGWLTRKVVGIYELKNIKPVSKYDRDVLIIFSDNILILNIIDQDYYSNEKLSVSDILLHSLINQKPLPNYDTFPRMKVIAWSEITDIVATSYQGVNNMEYIRILNTSLTGFNSGYSRNYQIKFDTANINITSNEIIQLITKSKILSKSQPFHLFKARQQAKVFYTAQDVSVYHNETTKSPFTIYLNMDIDTKSMFTNNPDLQMIMQVSLTEQVKVATYLRTGQTTNKTIEPKQFGEYVYETMGKTVETTFTTFNKVTRAIIGSNGDDLLNLVGKSTPKKDPVVKKSESGNISVCLASITSNQQQPEPKAVPSRKKSFLSKLISPFKRRNKAKKEKNKPKQEVQPAIPEVHTKPEQKTTTKRLSHTKSEPELYTTKFNSKKLIHTKSKPELYTVKSNNSANSVVIHPSKTHEDNKIVNVKSAEPDKTANDTSIIPNQETAEIVQVKRVNGAQLVRTNSQSSTIKLHEPKSPIVPSISSQVIAESPQFSMKQIDSSINLIGHTRRPSIPFIHEFQDYYSDGNPNWQVTMSRDNSNLSDTLDPQDTTEKFFDDIDILQEKSMMINKRLSSNHSSIFSNNTVVQSSSSINRNNSRTKSKLQVSIPRELSVQSITPSEYALQLGNIIDHEFSRIAEEPEYEITLQPIHPNLSMVTLTSSEEEEFEFFNHPHNLAIESTHNSDTSDVTLTDKTMPITETMRDESIAQLSALLENKETKTEQSVQA